MSYQQGTYPGSRILKQGFPAPGEYGMQFALTVLPGGGAKNRTVYLSLTDGNGEPHEYSDKALDVLRYLGFRGDSVDFGKLDPSQDGHFSFVGMEIECYCSVKARDDGTTKENWYINTPSTGGGAIVSPESADIRKLNSLFGKAMKTGSASSPPPKIAPPEVSAPAPPIDLTLPDDGPDIPF